MRGLTRAGGWGSRAVPCLETRGLGIPARPRASRRFPRRAHTLPLLETRTKRSLPIYRKLISYSREARSRGRSRERARCIRRASPRNRTCDTMGMHDRYHESQCGCAPLDRRLAPDTSDPQNTFSPTRDCSRAATTPSRTPSPNRAHARTRAWRAMPTPQPWERAALRNARRAHRQREHTHKKERRRRATHLLFELGSAACSWSTRAHRWRRSCTSSKFTCWVWGLSRKSREELENTQDAEPN